MEESKFFKFIWRINALAICVAALGAACFVLIGGWFIIADMRTYDTPPPIADLQGDTTELEDLRIYIPYDPRVVQNYTYFELRTGKDSYSKLSSSSKSQRRNIAVFDLEAGTTKWIFDGPQQEIEAYETIGKSIPGDIGNTEYVVTGFILTVATSQTDMSVVRDIWIMSPSGEDLRKVVENISGKVDIQRYGNSEVRLVTETKTSIDIYPVNVDALTLDPPTTVSVPK